MEHGGTLAGLWLQRSSLVRAWGWPQDAHLDILDDSGEAEVEWRSLPVGRRVRWHEPVSP
jgi:hypothetical protein